MFRHTRLWSHVSAAVAAAVLLITFLGVGVAAGASSPTAARHAAASTSRNHTAGSKKTAKDKHKKHRKNTKHKKKTRTPAPKKSVSKAAPKPGPAKSSAPASATASSSSTSAAFVTRSGSQLMLNGRPWRFTGVNMYWLGLDENVTDSGGPTYPTHAAVDNGFASAQAVHAQLVRSTTLGVSVGSPRSLEPTLGTFNDAAFASIDYAVYDARRYGVRLMIPLTDEWHYYHGGKHTFTNWLGYPDTPGQNCVSDSGQRQNEAEFYSDPAVIAAYLGVPDDEL